MSKALAEMVEALRVWSEFVSAHGKKLGPEDWEEQEELWDCFVQANVRFDVELHKTQEVEKKRKAIIESCIAMKRATARIKE